jgi:hypothetical protein
MQSSHREVQLLGISEQLLYVHLKTVTRTPKVSMYGTTRESTYLLVNVGADLQLRVKDRFREHVK